MAEWKVNIEEDYFKIYDSGQNVVGYIDPDYGISYDDDDALEKVERMIKARDTVRGAFVMIPMLKFGIFDTDYDADITRLQAQLEQVSERASRWREFAEAWPNCAQNHVRISHTDHDMLSVSFPVIFDGVVALDKDELLQAVRPMLDEMHRRNLV